ncbi:hypothetical protein EG103P3_00013 [Enterococcus phage EG103P3]|nr:hypothetical protein EG103P3_00013 [Enterococcus phage EG103P3]
MELNMFTKEELDVIRALVQRSIDHAVVARIPLDGSALSQELVGELLENNSRKLLTLFKIRGKIGLLKEEEEV